MKKLVAAVVGVLATATVAVGVAFAGGGGGTVVASGFSCALLDGNGNIIITNNSIVTVYSNQQGSKAVLQCAAFGAGAPSLTFFNNANTGLLCNVPGYGTTADWSDKVGYNGNSQLTCTVSSNGDDSASSAGAGLG